MSIIIFRSLFWISNLVKFIHSEKTTNFQNITNIGFDRLKYSLQFQIGLGWYVCDNLFFSLWSSFMITNSKLGGIRLSNQILGGWFLKRLWPTQNIRALSNLYLQLTLLVVPSPKSCFESTTDFHSDQSMSQRWHIS